MKSDRINNILRVIEQLPSGQGMAWSADTVKIYSAILVQIPDTQYETVLNYLLKECEWRPAPAAIFKAAAAGIVKSLSLGTLIEQVRECIIFLDTRNTKEREKAFEKYPLIKPFVDEAGGFGVLRHSEDLSNELSRVFHKVKEEYAADIAEIAGREERKAIGSKQ